MTEPKYTFHVFDNEDGNVSISLVGPSQPENLTFKGKEVCPNKLEDIQGKIVNMIQLAEILSFIREKELSSQS